MGVGETGAQTRTGGPCQRPRQSQTGTMLSPSYHVPPGCAPSQAKVAVVRRDHRDWRAAPFLPRCGVFVRRAPMNGDALFTVGGGAAAARSSGHRNVRRRAC